MDFNPNLIGSSGNETVTMTRDEAKQQGMELFGFNVTAAPPKEKPTKGKGRGKGKRWVRKDRERDLDEDEDFPVFSWEEEDYTEMIVQTGPDTHSKAYNHSATRIPGVEGLLLDTGAFDNLSGDGPIQRQAEIAREHGHQVEWHKLPKTKNVSGVGGAAKSCTHKASVPGILENGMKINYHTPVIPDSEVPSLYGLDAMAKTNTYVGTKTGKLAMIPNGTDDQIIWPPGTTFIQCRKAPSQHWILTTSNWSRAKQSVEAPLSSGVPYTPSL